MPAVTSWTVRLRVGLTGLGAFVSLLLVGAGCATMPPGKVPNQNRPKLIVVLFGGGTRASESLGDPALRYTPQLGRELAPRGTLFTQLRVDGPVVHPNSAGAVVTGHPEWTDLDWTRPVTHPTLFEIFRRSRQAPDTATWALVYASILAKTGESSATGYGPAWGANVLVPPTIPRAASEAMDEQLRRAQATGSKVELLTAAWACSRQARRESRIALDGLKSRAARRFVSAYYEKWQQGGGSSSHDEFLAEAASQIMERFAPDVLVVAFGEIDCAHYGSWSRYVEAIRRTDALTARLWRRTQQLPAYSRHTLMLILPDHGREAESSEGLGYVHHGNFYTGEGTDESCRRVWMLALGPDIAQGRVIHKPLPIACVAATGLEYLGLAASPGSAPSALSLAR